MWVVGFLNVHTISDESENLRMMYDKGRVYGLKRAKRA